MASPTSPSTPDSSGFVLGASLVRSDVFSSNDSLAGFASATSPTVKKPVNTGSSSLAPRSAHSSALSAIRHYSRAQKVTLRDVVESLARSIAKVARDNDKLPALTHVQTEFDAARAPDVDLVWYLWRIVNDLNAAKEPVLFRTNGSSAGSMNDLNQAASVSGGEMDDTAMGRGLRCLLLSLIYIDRMTQRSAKWFRVNSRNVHRVMLGTLYAALKFSDDTPGRLSYFAQLGGIPAEQLQAIELAVCKALQFDFYVTEDEFRATSLAHLDLAVKGAAARKHHTSPARA